MSNEAIGHGGCQCGAIRFRLTAAPARVYCCHCTECRRQSASAFGISALVAEGGVELLRGQPTQWSRATASGGTMACAFCPACGSRLWHRAGDVISVKGGALDETPEPSAHIWLHSKMPWVVIPEGVDQWQREPGDDFFTPAPAAPHRT